MSDQEQSRDLEIKVVVREGSYEFSTDLELGDTVLWLEIVKQDIIKGITGEVPDEN